MSIQKWKQETTSDKLRAPRKHTNSSSLTREQTQSNKSNIIFSVNDGGKVDILGQWEKTH